MLKFSEDFSAACSCTNCFNVSKLLCCCCLIFLLCFKFFLLFPYFFLTDYSLLPECPNANLLPVWEIKRFDNFQSPCLCLIRFDSVFIYRFSSNKRLVRLFILKYWGAVLVAGRHLKEGGAYFKVRLTFHMTLENSVNFFFPSNNK